MLRRVSDFNPPLVSRLLIGLWKIDWPISVKIWVIFSAFRLVTNDTQLFDRNFGLQHGAGINSHHWHWHLVYPVEGTYRDRRGELFYYMHNQMLARYDAERMANGLARVVPFHNWNEPIGEAYFPKLKATNAGLHWGSRPSGMILKVSPKVLRILERS